MKLIDFINMVIKENFRPRKIKVYGFIYNLINKKDNYCEFDYYSNSCKSYLLDDYDLDMLIDDANVIVEIVEE